MTTLFTHALTLSTMGIKHYEEKIPTQLESNPRFSHLEADVGPLHHRVAAAARLELADADRPALVKTLLYV